MEEAMPLTDFTRMAAVAMVIGMLYGCATSQVQHPHAHSHSEFSYLIRVPVPDEPTALKRHCNWLDYKIGQAEDFLKKEGREERPDGWHHVWRNVARYRIADLEARRSQVNCDAKSTEADRRVTRPNDAPQPDDDS
jgi:hypothetical protein